MWLELVLSLTLAASVAATRGALGARLRNSVLAGGVTFVVALPLLANVSAGPKAGFAKAPPVCRITSPAVTQPAACRPRLAGEPFRVVGAEIRLTNGGALPIVAGSVKSSIDLTQAAGNSFAPTTEIAGWAASPRLHLPASAVLVFSSGHFLGAVKPIVNRPDVGRAYRDAALDTSGFHFELPTTPVPKGARRPRIQLYGVAGGAASPISFDCAHFPTRFGC